MLKLQWSFTCQFFEFHEKKYENWVVVDCHRWLFSCNIWDLRDIYQCNFKQQKKIVICAAWDVLKKKKLYLNAFNSHSFILRELEKYMENRKHINHKSEREWEWSCSLWMEKRERKKNFKLKAPTNKSTRAINISFCKLTWCEPRQRGVKISIKFAEYHLCWIYLLFHFFSLSLCLCLKNEFCFFFCYWICYILLRKL